jgi:protease IV
MTKSTKWFLIIFGALIVAGGGMTLLFFALLSGVTDREADQVIGSGDKVAVVDLKGEIVSSEETVRQIKKYREDHSIRGILFRVDSPGGGVVASQEIFEEVRKTRKDGKPIVVSMGSLAASGGYYASCGANRIVANRGTLTGSIGVISQFMQYDTLLHKIGVNVSTLKSGKLKDAGSPYRPMTDADREYFQTMMDNVHHQFIEAVETERKIPHDSLVAIADGRVFTGDQALSLHLVDTIGTEEDAIRILGKICGIKGDPSIVKERKHSATLFDWLANGAKVPDLDGIRNELLNQPILQYRMQ